MNAEIASSLAQRIAEAGATKWASAGIPEDRVKLLAADVAVLLTSVLQPDFEVFAKRMEERGDTLGPDAGPYAAREWSYPENAEIAQEMSHQPVRDQIAYLWDHPELRGLAIKEVVDASWSFDVGKEYAEHWASGLYGKYSVFTPLDRTMPQLARQWGAGKVPGAWLELVVELSTGAKVTMRWDFAYLPEHKLWHPVFSSVNAGTGIRVVPLF
jgi:hypothetical protein